MEIDSLNNFERFTTGSKADEAIEVHDFEIVSHKEAFQNKRRPEKKIKT